MELGLVLHTVAQQMLCFWPKDEVNSLKSRSWSRRCGRPCFIVDKVRMSFSNFRVNSNDVSCPESTEEQKEVQMQLLLGGMFSTPWRSSLYFELVATVCWGALIPLYLPRRWFQVPHMGVLSGRRKIGAMRVNIR